MSPLLSPPLALLTVRTRSARLQHSIGSVEEVVFHADVDLQHQPVEDAPIRVVPLLGRLVHQRGAVRVARALDEEKVADGARLDLAGVSDDVILVAAVLQLVEVDVGVARVVRASGAGLSTLRTRSRRAISGLSAVYSGARELPVRAPRRLRS